MTDVETFRELRAAIEETVKKRELVPPLLRSNQSLKEVLRFGVVILLATWILLWGVLSFFPVETPIGTSFNIGFFAFCLFLIFPFVSVIRINSKGIRFHLPSWMVYSGAHQFIACAALIFLLSNIINDASYYCLPQDPPQPSKVLGPQFLINDPRKMSSFLPVTSFQLYFYVWPISTAILYCFMLGLSTEFKGRREKKKPSVPRPPSFGVWLGESTGTLSNLWHDANMEPHQQVGLALQDACQNIVILGAIGSGKTTRAMHPLLIQLLDQDCGGLIFDIKGDFQKAVVKFASMTKRQVIVVGVNQDPLNLLEGLSPEMASSFLKSALLLAGNARTDSFWIDTSVELCRNALGVLSFVPEHYTLKGLYLYLFEKSFAKEVADQLPPQKPDSAEDRLLKSYQQYINSVFSSFDEKVRNGVLANVSQILSSFQHPDLIDAFCTPKNPTHRMESVLEGTIYVVDMPLARFGLAGKVIYTLIKLRFFNVMQQRALHLEWNQTRPVFFMCDEYQEIVSCNKDGLSDLNFWDKSRSSHTIGIISAQSVSSFYAAIGERDLVHALLQNFRQKLVFRVEDDWTISYCNRLLGQVETQKIVHSTTTSHGSNGSDSSTQSINYQQKEVINGQLFRNMEPNQALALLSLKRGAADDVLTVKPVFL